MTKLFVIGEKMREELKNPLGLILNNSESIREQMTGKRIIAVGDVCVLNLLSIGIKPHLSVFDFRTKRQEIDEKSKEQLETEYPVSNRREFDNPPGVLSNEILEIAPELIKKGGGILIIGEEDLTALAFILAAEPKQDIVVYGQPDVGMVMVKPERKTKQKIEKLLALTATAFSDKV